MEYASGNIYIRRNQRSLGGHVPAHGHGFDHTTFFPKGWWLVRGMRTDGTEFVAQYCSAEFVKLREMYARYEPETLTRPVRMPDIVVDGLPQFVVVFIGHNDDVPSGGEEIVFNPVAHEVLILKQARHELLCLHHDGDAACVYSHRTPQGKIVQTFTGWPDPYV